MAFINTLGLLVTFICLYLSCKSLLSRRLSRPPLPPGPLLLPTSIPERDIWRTFQNWHAKYGPLISLRVGSQIVIILGDRRTAQDLLEKRGNIYSSRPKSIFVDKYLSKGLQPAFMQYNTVWRLHRRLHTSLLSAQVSQSYHKIQDLESKQLAYEMLSTSDFYKAFHRFTASTMFTLVYGKELSSEDLETKEVKHIDEVIGFWLQAISVGSFLVDAFPFLDRVPRLLARWKTVAERIHQNTKTAFTRCNDIGINGEKWNWSKEVLRRKEAKELPHEQLAFSMGELYIAGSHTSQMFLETFVVTSLLHPAATQEVQKELDSVVGLQRLPSFEDVPKLPYVNAFISEVLRWRQIAPLGAPHSSSKDDEYMGYTIPANSVVIANQWQMNMDENIFETPELFQPQRWIQHPDLPLSAFGFGRRVCPGQRVAWPTLFISISRLLWAYNIVCPDEDCNGQERAADQSGHSGGGYGPSVFNARFEIRSREHQEVVKSEWDLADKDRKQILANIGNTIFGTGT